MEFFDKLTKKASETYKGAAEKTGKIAKEAKLKLKINDNKSKINDIYEEIGKKVYQKHASNEDICIKQDLEEECARIDELSAEIEGYHKEILELSNEKACTNCGEHMSKDAKFCPKCGTRFKPKWYHMYITIHLNGSRIAKCPNCGRKGFCEKKK
mgnify:CR=1 FL=1